VRQGLVTSEAWEVLLWFTFLLIFIHKVNLWQKLRKKCPYWVWWAF